VDALHKASGPYLVLLLEVEVDMLGSDMYVVLLSVLLVGIFIGYVWRDTKRWRRDRRIARRRNWVKRYGSEL
jgi:hypothetical protein